MIADDVSAELDTMLALEDAHGKVAALDEEHARLAAALTHATEDVEHTRGEVEKITTPREGASDDADVPRYVDRAERSTLEAALVKREARANALRTKLADVQRKRDAVAATMADAERALEFCRSASTPLERKTIDGLRKRIPELEAIVVDETAKVTVAEENLRSVERRFGSRGCAFDVVIAQRDALDAAKLVLMSYTDALAETRTDLADTERALRRVDVKRMQGATSPETYLADVRDDVHRALALVDELGQLTARAATRERRHRAAVQRLAELGTDARPLANELRFRDLLRAAVTLRPTDASIDVRPLGGVEFIARSALEALEALGLHRPRAGRPRETAVAEAPSVSP